MICYIKLISTEISGSTSTGPRARVWTYLVCVITPDANTPPTKADHPLLDSEACVCAHVCVLRHCTSLLCLQLSCFVSDNFIFELLIGHKPRPYRKYGSVDAQLPFTDLDFSKCCWEPQPQYLWTYSKEFVVVITCPNVNCCIGLASDRLTFFPR